MSPVEKIIKEKLIRTLFEGFPISEEFRKFLAPPPLSPLPPLRCKFGEMSIIDNRSYQKC